MKVDQRLISIQERPGTSGLLLDFDGTLSTIVDDPAAARPLDAVPNLLGLLARRYKRVAVLSGRPVSFLDGLVPKSVLLSGLYGLEVTHRGKRRDHPLSGVWREVVADVVGISEAQGPPGMRVESKGLSLTLHFREHPDIADDVRRWAERQATRSGLLCRSARMSYELHPPIHADKGTALSDLAKGLTGILYIGDDLGDLPAFDALDELAGTGIDTVRVAVGSDEAPHELLQRADLVVDGPAEVVEFLRGLL